MFMLKLITFALFPWVCAPNVPIWKCVLRRVSNIKKVAEIYVPTDAISIIYEVLDRYHTSRP